MKKIYLNFCLLLIGISIHAQINYHVAIPSQEVITSQRDGYTTVCLNGMDGYTDEVGKPQLPYVIKRFVIPRNAKVSAIQISRISQQKMDGSFHIYPSQVPVLIGSQENQSTVYFDSLTYNSNQNYPVNYFENLSEELYWGYRIVTLKLYPIAYNPVLKELYIYSFDVTIEYELAGSSEDPSVEQSERRRSSESNFIRSIVANKNDIQAFYNFSVKRAPRLAATDGVTSVEDEDIIPDYIIITPDSLKDTFKELADWRTKKGIYTIIKPVEEIATGFQGNDFPEQIRNYLKEANKRWGSSLFVLLGGDVDLIPTRYCIGINNVLRPADPYYANVTGSNTWNSNGNNIYGEIEDNNPPKFQDLNVGRAPVNNKREAQLFIQKIISYERADGVMNEPSYYKNRLITAASLDDNASSISEMYNLYNFYQSVLKTRSNTRFLFDKWKVTTSTPDPLCSLFTRSNFLSALGGDGIDSLRHFHIVYHMDHSGPQSMGTSGKERAEAIYNADVDGIKNGKFYQIIMSGGCHPASIDKDCIAEHFLKNAEGGAVAFIGNSDSGINNEYSQYENFERALLDSNKYNLGEVYRSAALFCSTGLGAANKPWRLHLLGDPNMNVWTDAPKRFTINVSYTKETTGDYLITVTSAQQLPDECYITVNKDEEIYYTGIFTGNEKKFRVTPHSNGIVNITVAAHNYIPYENTIFVDSKNLSTLRMDTVFISDLSGGLVVGNGNGKLEAGETVVLNMKLKNNGSVSIPQLSAQVRCKYNGVTFPSGSSIVWGTVNAGAIAIGQIRFQVNKDSTEILQSDPDGIGFSFVATDVNGKTYYVKDVKLSLYHSDLRMQQREIVSTSNGNRTIDPGDSVKMNIHILNFGHGKASRLIATLQGANISTATVSYPDIEGHNVGVNTIPFSYKVSTSYRAGSPLNATLKIQNQFGKIWQYPIDLAEFCDTISPRFLKYTCDEKSIQVYWKYVSSYKGYNIYRSPTDNEGNNLEQYVKLNNFPLSSAYYTDTELEPLKRYYYKVTALSSTGAESNFAITTAIVATTSYETIGLFPISVLDQTDTRIDNSTFAADINNDGKMELFTSVKRPTIKVNGKEVIKSLLVVKTINGDDLFDIDNNVTTNSGFVEVSNEFSANPAICQLTKYGEQLVFFVNRAQAGIGSSLYCYSFKDLNADGKPDLKWEKKISDGSFIASVVADDLDGDGTRELILRAEGGKIYVYSVTNDNLYSFASGNAYADVAVADLDGDGKKEIIAGFQNNGVCIYKYDGTPFSANPVFTCAGYGFQATPVVCDLDNDGMKEILIMGHKQSNSNQTAVFAFKPDGTLVPGWDGSQISNYAIGIEQRNVFQNISVGDLDHDGNLEVVVPGIGNVKVWRNDGTLYSMIPVEGLKKQNSPILADVDEEDNVEIIISVDSKIYAFHPDGSNVKGFPVVLEDGTRESACVADIDNDGKNELVACSRRLMYVWKTPGDADNIEWGMDRHDVWNTGEYACPPRMIRANTTWNQPYYSCGSLLVSSGILTLNLGCTLKMSKDAKLIVSRGATLKLNGGKIENTDIQVESGGAIQILNQGKITLRKGGFFEVEKGGAMDCSSGDIVVTK